MSNNSKKGFAETLRGRIEFLHDLVIKRCFDSKVGTPLNRRLIEAYKETLRHFAFLPNNQLANI